MNKHIIELRRGKHIKGYGIHWNENSPYSDKNIWGKIFELCNTKGEKYVKHWTEEIELPIEPEEFYIPKCNSERKIPYCTLVINLIVYTQ